MKKPTIKVERREVEQEGIDGSHILDAVLEKCRMLLVFTCVYATTWCFLTGMEIHVYREVWMAVIMGTTVLTYALQSLWVRFRWSAWITVPLFLLSYFVVAYYYWEDVFQGLYYILVRFVELFKAYYRVSLRKPVEFIPEWLLMHEPQYYVTFFVVMASILITVIVSMICYNKMNVLWYLLYTAPFVVIPLALGKIPQSNVFILYGCATVVAMCGVKGQKRWRDTRIQGRVMLVMALYCLICVGVVNFVYPEGTYAETVDLTQAKKDLRNKVEEISKMDVFSDMTAEEWIRYNFSRGIDYGKLGKTDEVKYDNNTVLRVRMDSHHLGDDPKPLYLKGYVGEKYMGDHWQSLGDDAIRASLSSMYEDVDSEDVNNLFIDYIDTMYGKMHFNILIDSFANEEIIDAEKPNKLFIQNVAAGRERVFVPYFMRRPYYVNADGRIRLEEEVAEGEQYEVDYFPAITKAMGETVVDGKGEMDYRYSEFMGQMKEGWFGRTAKTSNLPFVNQFVEDNYLTIPDDVEAISLDNVMDWVLADTDRDIGTAYQEYYASEHGSAPPDPLVVEEYIEDGVVKRAVVFGEKEWNEDLRGFIKYYSARNIGEVIERVRKNLWDRTTYTLSPGETPADRDFVDYFLFESKKGYCVHYATAATLLFRALGIPSRMVEGYVVTPEAMEKAKSAADGKEDADEFVVRVPDSNAHAWVEVYMDGIGWIPVEVTPGGGEALAGTEATSAPSTATTAPSEEPDRRGPDDDRDDESPKKGSDEAEKLTARYAGPYGGLLKALDGMLERLDRIGATYVIMAFALLSFAFSTLTVRKRMYEIYRAKVLKRQDTRKRAAFLYHRLVKVFRLYGVSYDRQNVERYADQVTEAFRFIGLREAKVAFLEGAFKSAFARSPISEDEYREMEKFYDVFCGRLYENVKPHNRWYLKYILCV